MAKSCSMSVGAMLFYVLVLLREEQGLSHLNGARRIQS